jgi:oligoribonuclease NrnB/cAMP/cGMP phosphodiesterase (DHH superfamily)
VSQKKAIICSHISDLDGVLSASIALIKFPKAEVFFHSYGLYEFKTMFQNVIKTIRRVGPNGILFISDLGINPELEGLCLNSIGKIVKMHWDVVWVDHHPWLKRVIASIRKLAVTVHDESGTKCAAELMQEFLLPSNLMAKQLSQLAHKMDFMVGENDVPPISELIQYYRTLSNTQKRLRGLTYKAATGILWDTNMQSDYLKYLARSKTEKRKAMSSLRIVQVGKFRVVIIKVSKYLQTSLFSKEIFHATAADVAILYNAQGKVSIRRNNSHISCRSIAIHLANGGGHEFAAGGMIRLTGRGRKGMQIELEQIARKSLGGNIH